MRSAAPAGTFAGVVQVRPPFVDRLMFTEARPAREKRASDQTTATCAMVRAAAQVTPALVDWASMTWPAAGWAPAAPASPDLVVRSQTTYTASGFCGSVAIESLSLKLVPVFWMTATGLLQVSPP